MSDDAQTRAYAFLVLVLLVLAAGLWYVQIGMIIADYEHAKIERNCPGHRHPLFERPFFIAAWPFAGMDLFWDLVPRDQLICDRFD